MMYPPTSTAQLAQSFARFKQLRETTPVLYDDATQHWHVFRYDDALQVLTDPQHFAPIGYDGASLPLLTNSMIDPSRQRLVRTLVRQATPPRLVIDLKPHITATAQALLDRARPLGMLDVIGDLAAPLSMAVFAELVGIPVEHHLRLTHWLEALNADQVTAHDTLRTDAPLHTTASAALQ